MNKKSNVINNTFSDIIPELRAVAIDSLSRMYRPKEKLFAFRLRKDGEGEILEGVSRRYTATVLIGLACEDEQVTTKVLGNHSPEDICNNLINDIDTMNDLGQAALTCWAARAIKHPLVHKVVEALGKFYSAKNAFTIVELSWALTALSFESDIVTNNALIKKFAEILMDSFNPKSAIFSHGSVRKISDKSIKKYLSLLFRHVSCFADFVYPIQALSYYYKLTRDSRAAEIVFHCSEQMCKLQGDEGQWWWHFDNRTGRVLERFPVYSVHQDSMAPMALFAVEKTFGTSFTPAIEKGLNWLNNSPEISGSLIDTKRNIIWRKVTRREPRKLVRSLQAASSRIYSGFRAPAVDFVFPACEIDYESRPYHAGWILHAWPQNQKFGFSV